MASLVNAVVAPLHYGFLVRGLTAAVLVGIVCAVIGTFVVLKGLAFIGDALAHVSFTGVVVALLAGFGFYLGAVAAAVLTALGISVLTRRVGVRSDTAIGILFSGVFALGIVLMSVGIKSYTVDLFSYIFGDVLAVRPRDLLIIVALGLAVLLLVSLLYKELLFTAFDPIVAEAAGLPVGVLQTLLMVLLALTVVVSVQAVGVVLVVAMLVTPSATAYLLVDRFPAMLGLGALLGGVDALVGFYLSYYANVPSGGAIVLVASLGFILAALFSPKRGRWLRLLVGQ
ncbi:MAG: metal ABC transporter permease [Thermorudis peleae]|nr:metal ABC transporter permease [Thermorudis peleae]MBX6754958.1 metal ABC transporter permease [Thermorudis peleae]